MRMWITPLNFTGGESDDCTVTTAISLPSKTRFSTANVGGGRMFPSVFISANCRSNSSVTGNPLTVLLFLAPTKTNPGFSCRGRSLAKAQIASRILEEESPDKDSLNLRRSDSMSEMISSNPLSVRDGISIPSRFDIFLG